MISQFTDSAHPLGILNGKYLNKYNCFMMIVNSAKYITDYSGLFGDLTHM